MKERPSWTYALEVMMQATQGLDRVECHGTLDGVKAVVKYEGQMYEILANPLYKYAEVASA